MDVLFLAECTDTIPQLAAWFRAEWPDEVGGDIENIFELCTNTGKIPIGLVAVENGRPVGTVQLLSTSVHSHPHLVPWIGGLFVEPNWRHRGVATRLIDAAVATAKSIGVAKLYIGVGAARDYYERHGWRYEEDGSAHGETVMIFSQAI